LISTWVFWIFFATAFSIGILFGDIGRKYFYDKLESFFLDSQDKIYARRLQEEIKKVKKIRRSKAYHDRLNSILKSIKEAPINQSKIQVMYLDECPTDRQIIVELRKRNFSLSFPFDKRNTMEIRWKPITKDGNEDGD
jgi:hypothetical protein